MQTTPYIFACIPLNSEYFSEFNGMLNFGIGAMLPELSRFSDIALFSLTARGNAIAHA